MKIMKIFIILFLQDQFITANYKSLLKNFPFEIFYNSEKKDEFFMENHSILNFLKSRKLIGEKDDDGKNRTNVFKSQTWEKEVFLISFLLLKKILSVNNFLINIDQFKNQFTERKNYYQAYEQFEFKLEMMHTFKNPTQDQIYQKFGVQQISSKQFEEFKKTTDVPEQHQNLVNLQPQNFDMIKKQLFIKEDPFNHLNYFEFLSQDMFEINAAQIQRYKTTQNQHKDENGKLNTGKGPLFLKYDSLQFTALDQKFDHQYSFQMKVPGIFENKDTEIYFRLNIDQMIQCLIDLQFANQILSIQIIKAKIQQYKLQSQLQYQDQIKQIKLLYMFFQQEDDIKILKLCLYKLRSKIIEELYLNIKFRDKSVEFLNNEFLDQENFTNLVEQDKKPDLNHYQIPLMQLNLEQSNMLQNISYVYYQQVLLFAQQILRAIFADNDKKFRLISCFTKGNHFETNDKCPKPIQKYVQYLSLYVEDFSFSVLINVINFYPCDELSKVKKNVSYFIDYLYVYIRDQELTKQLQNQDKDELSLINNLEMINRLTLDALVPNSSRNNVSLEDEKKAQYEKIENEYQQAITKLNQIKQEIQKNKNRKLEQQTTQNNRTQIQKLLKNVEDNTLI